MTTRSAASALTSLQSAFGAPDRAPPEVATLAQPAPGETLFVVGPSGCGKTLALMGLRGNRLPALDLSRGVLAQAPIHVGVDAAFGMLTRCGLSDATLRGLPVSRLSAGERARLRVALLCMSATDGARVVLDEPWAHLDDLTATMLAKLLARMARRHAWSLVIATHRPWLSEYFDRVSVQHLGGPIAVAALDDVRVDPATRADWRALSRYHYASKNLAPVDRIWRVTLGGSLAAVAVVTYPHLMLSSRKTALGEDYSPSGVRAHGASMLNRDVRCLSRVVVHPRFRGMGLATRLARHSCENTDSRFMECLTLLGAYSGFLKRAGFVCHGPVARSREQRRLQRVLTRQGLTVEQLTDHVRRGSELAPEVQAALGAFWRRRVETGHSSLRDQRRVDRAKLLRALGRFHARPQYWVKHV